MEHIRESNDKLFCLTKKQETQENLRNSGVDIFWKFIHVHNAIFLIKEVLITYTSDYNLSPVLSVIIKELLQ